MTTRSRLESHTADWVSPNTALINGTRSRLDREDPPPAKDVRQSLDEAYWVAAMMKGLAQLEPYHPDLEMIPIQEHAPDIRLSQEIPLSGINSVEVVLYRSGCAEVKNRTAKTNKKIQVRNVAEFLLYTKLHPVFAYPASTAILCIIDRNQDNMEWGNVHQVLKESGRAQNEVYLIQRCYPALVFQLARVFPKFDRKVQFHLLQKNK